MVWVYAVLVAAGTALFGPPAIWDGVDSTVNRGHYKPSAVEYRTWVSSPNMSKTECTFTVFALVTREKLTRLRSMGSSN